MTFEEVYEKLDKFVHHLAWRHANGAPLMDHDEIAGELYIELVKGFQYYEHLPEGQLLAVLRRMMDNRIAELIHKYYGTHRKAAIGALSMSRLLDDDDTVSRSEILFYENFTYTTADELGATDPLAFVESIERVEAVYDIVGDEAKTVLCAVLHGNSLLGEHLTLSGIRASFVYKKNGTVKVKPWQVANSLAMDEKIVRKAFKEIRKAYAEVCNA